MKRLGALLIVICFSLAAKAQSSFNLSKQQFRDQFLEAINTTRAAGCNCGTTYMRPARPLVWNDVLANAARNHARDMYRNQYFSHESQDGTDLSERLIKAGYTYKGYQRYAIGENIAFNQRSVEEVLAGWFKSADHCKNLMNPEFNEIGIAENNYYWVQDFGGRVSFASR